MSEPNPITVPVRLDRRTFRRFAVFNTFRRQKRWRLPAGFAAIMLAFAVYIFLQTDRAQSGLIGGVLTAVGLSLPAIYLISFSLNLRDTVKKHGLPRRVYTVTLSGTGVYIRSDPNRAEELTLPWDTLHAACRVTDAVYLYVVPARAFLLPAGQADAPDDALWALLTARMPKDTCRDLRKKAK